MNQSVTLHFVPEQVITWVIVGLIAGLLAGLLIYKAPFANTYSTTSITLL